ncbi:MAG: protein translocase subunit SecF [Leptospira sp.]|nr:protein translocase subunit SecF [Leptospira sp.]
MIDFSRLKYLSISFSVIMILFGFGYTSFVHKGFAHSLDFNGGLRAVVNMDKKVSRQDIEKYFKEKEIETVIILLDKERNNFQIDIGLGAVPKIADYNTRIREKSKADATMEKKPSSIDELIFMLQHDFKLNRDNFLSADQVGAVVGGELTSTGIILLLSTLAIMTVYLSFRFQFRFALAASLALVHDLLFTIAMIGFFQIKPSIPIIAALLTLLGYSINDTIVIFDRIRENSSGKLKDTFSHIINVSINQTLGRTINTSVATLISIIAIIISGAVELYDFAYVLVFGIVIGTYSSIFIAAPVIEIYGALSRKKI